MCRVCVRSRYMLHLLLLLISPPPPAGVIIRLSCCVCSDNGWGIRADSETESVEENKPKNIRRSYLTYKNGYRFWLWISRLDVSCIRFAPWKRNKNIPKLPPPPRDHRYLLELFLCECLFRSMAGGPCKPYRWAFWVFATDRSDTK